MMPTGRTRIGGLAIRAVDPGLKLGEQLRVMKTRREVLSQVGAVGAHKVRPMVPEQNRQLLIDAPGGRRTVRGNHQFLNHHIADGAFLLRNLQQSTVFGHLVPVRQIVDSQRARRPPRRQKRVRQVSGIRQLPIQGMLTVSQDLRDLHVYL